MKRNWKKFAQLDKKDKIFRVINLVLMLSFFVASLLIAIVNACNGIFERMFMASLAMSALFIVPLILELIFGRRLSNVVTLCYVLYVVLSGFIGSLLNVYYYWPGFDKFIHMLFGYFVCIPGIFVLSLTQNYKKFNPLTIALFCVFFSLSIELLWEIAEFAIDRMLNQTMQGAHIDGYGVPLVLDTIIDMSCNLCGTIFFFIHFMIGKKTKHNLGINVYERELAVVKNDNSETEIPIEKHEIVSNEEKNDIVKNNKFKSKIKTNNSQSKNKDNENSQN